MKGFIPFNRPALEQSLVRAILFVLICGLARSIDAANYFVATDGVDDQSVGRGTTQTFPWRTIAYAVQQVPGGQGHTIYVRAGNYGGPYYPDGTGIVISKSYLTIVGYNDPANLNGLDSGVGFVPTPGTTVTLNPAVIPVLTGWSRASFTGFQISSNVTQVQIRNFGIRDFACGLETLGTSYCTFRNIVGMSFGDVSAGANSGLGTGAGRLRHNR
jgi:hypothetical protein